MLRKGSTIIMKKTVSAVLAVITVIVSLFAFASCGNGGKKTLHIRQAVGLHFPKGGEAMRITFHIGEFTITIIVKKR